MEESCSGGPHLPMPTQGQNEQVPDLKPTAVDDIPKAFSPSFSTLLSSEPILPYASKDTPNAATFGNFFPPEHTWSTKQAAFAESIQAKSASLAFPPTNLDLKLLGLQPSRLGVSATALCSSNASAQPAQPVEGSSPARETFGHSQGSTTKLKTNYRVSGGEVYTLAKGPTSSLAWSTPSSSEVLHDPEFFSVVRSSESSSTTSSDLVEDTSLSLVDSSQSPSHPSHPISDTHTRVPQTFTLHQLEGLTILYITGSGFNIPILPLNSQYSQLARLGSKFPSTDKNSQSTQLILHRDLRKLFGMHVKVIYPEDWQLWSSFKTASDEEVPPRPINLEPKTVGRKSYTNGFDTQIFSLSCRLHKKPRIVSYVMSGPAEATHAFANNVYKRRCMVSDTLYNIMGHDMATSAMASDFESLAAAFFAGKEVVEDYDNATNVLASETGPKVYKITYGNEWSEILENAPLSDKVLANFLQDVVMANQLERACTSRESIEGVRVYRHQKHAKILADLKKAASTEWDDDDHLGQIAHTAGVSIHLIENAADVFRMNNELVRKRKQIKNHSNNESQHESESYGATNGALRAKSSSTEIVRSSGNANTIASTIDINDKQYLEEQCQVQTQAKKKSRKKPKKAKNAKPGSTREDSVDESLPVESRGSQIPVRSDKEVVNKWKESNSSTQTSNPRNSGTEKDIRTAVEVTIQPLSTNHTSKSSAGLEKCSWAGQAGDLSKIVLSTIRPGLDSTANVSQANLPSLDKAAETHGWVEVSSRRAQKPKLSSTAISNNSSAPSSNLVDDFRSQNRLVSPVPARNATQVKLPARPSNKPMSTPLALATQQSRNAVISTPRRTISLKETKDNLPRGQRAFDLKDFPAISTAPAKALESKKLSQTSLPKPQAVIPQFGKNVACTNSALKNNTDLLIRKKPGLNRDFHTSKKVPREDNAVASQCNHNSEEQTRRTVLPSSTPMSSLPVVECMELCEASSEFEPLSKISDDEARATRPMSPDTIPQNDFSVSDTISGMAEVRMKELVAIEAKGGPPIEEQFAVPSAEPSPDSEICTTDRYGQISGTATKGCHSDNISDDGMSSSQVISSSGLEWATDLTSPTKFRHGLRSASVSFSSIGDPAHNKSPHLAKRSRAASIEVTSLNHLQSGNAPVIQRPPITELPQEDANVKIDSRALAVISKLEGTILDTDVESLSGTNQYFSDDLISHHDESDAKHGRINHISIDIEATRSSNSDHVESFPAANFPESSLEYHSLQETSRPLSPVCDNGPTPPPDIKGGGHSMIYPIVHHCFLCRSEFLPTAADPLVFCPGCGPHSNIRYCSFACLLANSFEHAEHCAKYPETDQLGIYEYVFPPELCYDPMALPQADNFPISREKFRQKLFSRYCYSGPFPQVLAAWAKRRPYDVPDRVNLDETSKRTGDYHVFRSGISAYDSLTAVEVIFTIKLRPSDLMKNALNRALNAAFITNDQTIVAFLFRLLRHLIIDEDCFDPMSSWAPKSEVISAFYKQFTLEFGIDVTKLSTQMDDFHFDHEWNIASFYIQTLRLKCPSLRRWLQG